MDVDLLLPLGIFAFILIVPIALFSSLNLRSSKQPQRPQQPARPRAKERIPRSARPYTQTL